MIVGTAQVDITPPVGVELSGFAARTQPSVGLLDPLYVRALWLEHAGERLLWIHADLIGMERELVARVREWVQANLGVPADRVIVSATHTHSGPATLRLREAGAYDAAYVDTLIPRMCAVAQAAMQNAEQCELVAVEGRCALAIDRRKRASAHTDPRVLALGWRRADGGFAAILINYAIHPVALGASNRQISADMPGQVVAALRRQLPGEPTVLFVNGACGNLNPPIKHVSATQLAAFGEEIAASVVEALRTAPPVSAPVLRVGSRAIDIPLDVLTSEQIEARAATALADPAPHAEWGEKYPRAVHAWREELLRQVNANAVVRHHPAELFAIRIADHALLGVNAEVFSDFTDWVRKATHRSVYTAGYANGDIGYLPTQAAYVEGGYEVDLACFFYGGFRVQAGALEHLAAQGADLVSTLFA